MIESRTFFADDGIAVVGAGNLMVADIGDPLSVARIKHVRSALASVGSRADVVLVAVFDMSRFDLKKTGKPGVREELQALAKEDGQRLRAVAVCVEGTGLVANTVRSTAMAIAVFVRPGYPVKIFSTAQDTAVFIDEQLRATANTEVLDVKAILGLARLERLNHR